MPQKPVSLPLTPFFVDFVETAFSALLDYQRQEVRNRENPKKTSGLIRLLHDTDCLQEMWQIARFGKIGKAEWIEPGVPTFQYALFQLLQNLHNEGHTSFTEDLLVNTITKSIRHSKTLNIKALANDMELVTKVTKKFEEASLGAAVLPMHPAVSEFVSSRPP